MQKGMYDNKIGSDESSHEDNQLRYSDRQHSEEESNLLEYPFENTHDV